MTNTQTSKSVKLIKSSATLIAVENCKTQEIKLESDEGTSFSKRLFHNVFLTTSSHNVFLTASFSQRFSQNVFFYLPQSPYHNFSKICQNYHFKDFSKITKNIHGSNKCSVFVPQENKIHGGIIENSSVQTTINNHVKSPKSH